MEYALITGATSGIGRAFAIELAKKGYNLILTGRREKELDNLKIMLEEKYVVSISLILGDFIDKNTVKKLFSEIEGKKIKFLINNVGYGNKSGFFEGDIEEALNMVEVHINSVIRICHKIAPLMKNAYIINVSSMAAYFPTKYNHIYAGTKNFLITFSESLNLSLSGKNVKVKVLCPGFTHTDFHREMHSIKNKDNLLKWMTSEEVARFAVKNLNNNKVVVVPGILNRAAYIFAKLVPKCVLYYFLKKQDEL